MTKTNIMVTAARKNISESKGTTLLLLILCLQEEIQPSVLQCKTKFFLH